MANTCFSSYIRILICNYCKRLNYCTIRAFKKVRKDIFVKLFFLSKIIINHKSSCQSILKKKTV